MMYFGNHIGATEWIFMILGTLIIVGLIVAVIMWAASSRTDRSSGATATGESPREILDRRLASGELTADQYQRLRETLGGAQPWSLDSRPAAQAAATG